MTDKLTYRQATIDEVSDGGVFFMDHRTIYQRRDGFYWNLIYPDMAPVEAKRVAGRLKIHLFDPESAKQVLTLLNIAPDLIGDLL